MTPNALFDAALQLAGTGWRVSGTEFQGEPKQLELRLEQDGRKVVCPECERRCTIYDRVEKRWRHLNFFQYRCELVAQVPRADCRKRYLWHHRVFVDGASGAARWKRRLHSVMLCNS